MGDFREKTIQSGFPTLSANTRSGIWTVWDFVAPVPTLVPRNLFSEIEKIKQCLEAVYVVTSYGIIICSNLCESILYLNNLFSTKLFSWAMSYRFQTLRYNEFVWKKIFPLFHNALRADLTSTFRRIYMVWLFWILETYQTRFYHHWIQKSSLKFTP